MKEKIKQNSILFFCFVTLSDEWKLKLLSDKIFVGQLLELVDDEETVWSVFENLAQHPGICYYFDLLIFLTNK
jgi:hypothetical protein